MSGLCAACNLVDNGFEVTLLEATDMLGGRASSWLDADGDTIDNALHVFFPHYLNCISFMQKVGAEPLHWTHGMAVHNREGVRGDLPMGGGLSVFSPPSASPPCPSSTRFPWAMPWFPPVSCPTSNWRRRTRCPCWSGSGGTA